MVVGGNKGYDCVGWLRFFSNGMAAPKSKAWAKRLPNQDPGVCKQGLEDYPVGIQQDPTVFCIEPMPANYKALKHAAEDIPNMIVVQNAVTLTDQPMVKFPDAAFGKEAHGISNRGADVTAITVDQFIHAHKRRPDILSVDTEGHDALVLLGAARALSSGSIKYLEFEYHEVGPWGSYKLKWVIDYLDNMHYDCYWAGNDGKTTKITKCWSDAFEFHEWSNVVCASRKSTCWIDALETSLA